MTAIILVLTALSIPLFRSTFSDLSAKDTSFNIAKLAGLAQERAIIEKKNFKIVFDFKNNRYQLFEIDSEKKAKKVTGRPGKLSALPQGLSFNDPNNIFSLDNDNNYKKEAVFYPDGHSEGFEIDLTNKAGGGYSVKSSGFGSMVEIKELKK